MYIPIFHFWLMMQRSLGQLASSKSTYQHGCSSPSTPSMEKLPDVLAITGNCKTQALRLLIITFNATPTFNFLHSLP